VTPAISNPGRLISALSGNRRFPGLMLAFAIQQFADCPVAWSLSAIVLSVSICLITGIVFGWYPARQAASLDPIKALHAE